MREFRKFFVDNISHHLDSMRLEYLALDGNVERIVRCKPAKSKSPKDRKGKGKAKQSTSGVSSAFLAEIVLGPGNMWPDGTPLGDGGPAGYPPNFEDSSDDDNANTDVSFNNSVKVTVLEGLRFSDVTDVKIFSPEIRGGRL